MPYVAKSDREMLDGYIEKLSNSIVDKLIKTSGTAEVSIIYREVIENIAKTIIDIKLGRFKKHSSDPAKELAKKIIEVADKYNYKGDFNGELNYSITRMIQLVPKGMVERGIWKESFRYWIYSQTVGAIDRAAMNINNIKIEKDEWIIDGIVGTLIDIKDEYKRRVNTAYEAVQIKKSGDCYDDTPYHTVLKHVGDGYLEIMKDFRK